MPDDTLATPVVIAECLLGEGPVWDADGEALWWVDIDRGHLNRFDPLEGSSEVIALGQCVSAVAIQDENTLLLALRHELATFDLGRRRLTTVCPVESDMPENRLNDGKCDAAGRFWIGSMRLDPARAKTGALYSYDARGRLRQHLTDIGTSNGIAWSSDGRTMYYIDTSTGAIDGFDFDAAHGELSNRRVVCRIPDELGRPDGMTIDVDDHLWTALWGGGCVVRVDPRRGEIVDRIRLSVSNPTSCTFGGEHLDELYITTARRGLNDEQLGREPLAGSVFMAKPGVLGRPAPYFSTR